MKNIYRTIATVILLIGLYQNGYALLPNDPPQDDRDSYGHQSPQAFQTVSVGEDKSPDFEQPNYGLGKKVPLTFLEEIRRLSRGDFTLFLLLTGGAVILFSLYIKILSRMYIIPEDPS